MDSPVVTKDSPDKAILTETAQTPEEKIAQTDDDTIKELLYKLMEKAENEDVEFRYRMLQICRRNTLYFNNIQRIFYDEVARDYRSIDAVVTEIGKLTGVDDIKTINIYRAFAESLISALSVSTPNVEFLPEDAENDFDIETAAAYTKIADIVQKKCAALLEFIKALTIHYNQGVVFAYNFYKQDPSYGVVTSPKRTARKQIKVVDLYCPECWERAEEGLPATQDSINQPISCMDCGYQGIGSPMVKPDFVDEVVEWEHTPKGMSGFSIFGPTHVKAPLYARKQEDVGYLILRLEDDAAKFRKVYDTDKIQEGGGDTVKYERWSRVPIEYYGAMPVGITTCRYGFFRPWYYYKLEFEEAKLLEAKFPNGVKVEVIDTDVLAYESCRLDDHWTVTYNPMSDFLHAEPPGNQSIPIQDAENDLYNLGLMSIEYGVPETFAHPKTLALDKYSEGVSSPGMLTPALPPSPDQKISDGFHTIKAATLSNEYTNFERTTQELGQFVTGAVPSLWGGTNTAGSNTATEYTESRARALQRLQLTWRMMSIFWPKIIFKASHMFAQNLREDQQFAVKENGTFINVWIRKTELSGKVGQVEPEASEQLPQTWMQKRDFFMELVKLQDENIGQVLLHPNNAELLKEITGMKDMYIPGEYDRNKQWAEFYLLSQQEPIGNRPSIEPDLDIDDHLAEMQVLKNILVSPVGLALYQNNPAGYTNNVLHYKAHELALTAKTMSNAGGKQPGIRPDSATKTSEG